MTTTELVLLGTAGGPRPSHARHGVASALVVDDQVLLIDAGRDACTQYHAAGLSYARLSKILLTHLHSDHICGLFDFFLLASFVPARDALAQTVSVYGPGSAGQLPDVARTPPGAAPRDPSSVPVLCEHDPVPGIGRYLDLQLAAAAYDINIRMRCSGVPDLRELIAVHEIDVPNVGADPRTAVAPLMDPFVIAEDDTVRVSAILVNHPQTFPSFGFRFDTLGGSIIFAGDTTAHPNVVTLAKDADVLVLSPMYEAFFAARDAVHCDYMRQIHITATDAGEVARAAGVGAVVLTHLAPSDPTLVDDDQWRKAVAAGFDGPVFVGTDLMRLNVSAIAAERPPATSTAARPETAVPR
ncbi:MAG: MBL fold metallo-hydrolase [Actinophytocola sp.]|nr:MBL fold metallo-hydrolase [Actinophytocola sp.]